MKPVDADSLFYAALLKLSEMDQARARDDFCVYGQAIIESRADGTVRLLSPNEVLIADVVPEEEPK